MYHLKSAILLLLVIYNINTFASEEKSKLWREPDAWSPSRVKMPSNWREPDAWGRRIKVAENDVIDGLVNSQQCKCPIAEECNADDNIQLSIIYYKKLINLLFNIDYYNEDDIGIYTRNLYLTLSSEQINVLKNSKDSRDWDAIVSNVFKNAERIKYPNLLPSNDNLIIVSFKWMKNTVIDIISMPQFTFLLCAIAFIFPIIYINKKYNYGIIAIFLLLCFLSGFAYTYYDCNKQLEIEELAALLESEGDDPCQNIQSEKKSWSIWKIFSTKTTKEQCIEHLKKKHKTKLPFCRPDDVFLVYVNEMILNQFQRIVEKCTNIFKTTLEKVPFPYNLVAVTIFGLMLPLFMKMLFQHIFDPRVWFHNSSSNISMPLPPTVVESKENELLNKLLLEKIEYNQKRTDAKLLNLERSISGVQILEATESIQQQNLMLEGSLTDTRILNSTPEILEPAQSIKSKNEN